MRGTLLDHMVDFHRFEWGWGAKKYAAGACCCFVVVTGAAAASRTPPTVSENKMRPHAFNENDFVFANANGD